MKWIFRYLKDILEHEILFAPQQGDNLVVGYVDANYSCNADDSKSTTGYIFTLSGAPICWRSTLLIAISTTELE